MIRFAKIALVTLACFAVVTASVGQSMVKKVKPKPTHHTTSKHHTPMHHHSKVKHHTMVKHHSKVKHHTSMKHKPMMKKPMAKKPMMKPMHASATK